MAKTKAASRVTIPAAGDAKLVVDTHEVRLKFCTPLASRRLVRSVAETVEPPHSHKVCESA